MNQFQEQAWVKRIAYTLAVVFGTILCRGLIYWLWG